MQTGNLKQRRPVVGSPTKVKRPASNIEAPLLDSVDGIAVAAGSLSNALLIGIETYLFTFSTKRNQSRAITPETEGASPTSMLQSPSKSRVKPSERSVSAASVVAHKGLDDDSPDAATAVGIVFTDDEDFVSVSVDQNMDGADSEDEHDSMPELRDVSASEDSHSEDGGNDQDAVVQDAGDRQVGPADDDEFEVIETPVIATNVASERRASVPVGKKKRSKIQETLDKMETERDMYVQARKHSVASIASTNPGDGTKRLHGEESYIHDDIKDSPFGERGRPRTVVPVTPTKTQKGVVRGNVYREGSKAERDDSNRGEEVVLMSDTEPRGQVGPAKCEVANTDDMDDIIDYSGLPALYGDRRFVSWSQMPGPGLAVPSAWHEENPAISMS
ncbi:hypothetical protein HWV62_7228 [Athelia sp. TMB]|nr:hypothetical protein HWV62_7228 [Athelia sp. TMB]